MRVEALECASPDSTGASVSCAVDVWAPEEGRGHPLLNIGRVAYRRTSMSGDPEKKESPPQSIDTRRSRLVESVRHEQSHDSGGCFLTFFLSLS